MKKISKVKPSHRKTKLRLRLWVKKSLKGLLVFILAIFTISFCSGGANDTSVITTDVVIAETSESASVDNLVVNNPVEEVVEVVEGPVERVNCMCSSSSVKTYMDYRAITNTASKQYKHIKNHMTVGEDGLLRDEDGNIGVALGSHFGDIGSKYEVVLDTGITFNVVKIDEKADVHVNNGCQHKQDGSVIEFVIDSSKFTKSSNGYVWSGNFNNNPDFKGKISTMYKID